MNSSRSLLNFVVSWAIAGVSGKILYVIGLHFDALIEMTQIAVYSRFPGLYSYETLPLHARSRQLDQGLGESNALFAGRLERYIDAHEDRGGPYPMLREIWEHYRHSTDGAFLVHLVYASGLYFRLDADGTVTRIDVAGFDTGIDDWANWILVYEWPEVIADDGLWDDDSADGGTWDTTPDGAWDLAAPYSFVQDIRLIPSKWNAAHAIGHILLLGPGQALWDVPDEDWNSEEEWDEGGTDDVAEILVY